MYEIRPYRLMSWFDHKSQPILSARLKDDLQKRLKGHKALFITLTYDRSDYEDPEDLYFQQQRRQDVPVFMRKLKKYLGFSLKGKWLRKMEFQKGGWVHFHIILVVNRYIPCEDLSNMWGHGYVNCRRLTKEKRDYITKYVSKSNEFPKWVYMQPTRSVKIISVSPGFWQRPKKYDNKPVTKNQYQRLVCAYVSIGQRLASQESMTLVISPEQEYRAHKVDMGTLLIVAYEMDIPVLTSKSLNCYLDCSEELLRRALARAEFYLIGKSNPEKQLFFLQQYWQEKYQKQDDFRDLNYVA